MVHDLFDVSGPDEVGRKGEHLRWLVRAGLPVPRTLVLPFDEATVLLGDDPGRAAAVRADLAARVDPARPYAVRSSADVEDGAEVSFAGQFLTRLDVTGAEGVTAAAAEVAGSARSDRLVAYASSAGVDPDAIRVAVLIQDMVPAVASGVSFSRNPVTGFDEIVVEAVEGSGERLVGTGTTPARWVVRWGGVTARPETGPPLPEDAVSEIAAATRAIAVRFGAPVDLEWVWDGTTVRWVQLRPARPVPPIPVYSNRIAREMLPGVIAPLTWTVNTPIVNGAWVELLTEAIGPNDLDPASLARRFAGRAYFDMGAFGRIFEALGMPRDALELLLGFEGGDVRPSFRPSSRFVRRLPRLTRLGWTLARTPRRVEATLAGWDARIAVLGSIDPSDLDERELMARVDATARLVGDLARANIVTPLLQAGWAAALRAAASRAGVDPSSFDPGRDDPRRREIDLRIALDELARRVASSSPEARAALENDGWASLDGAAAALRRPFEEMLERFGHVSDNQNDLSRASWHEDPDAFVAAVLAHDPATTSSPTGPVPPRLRALANRAGRARVLREQVASRYARAYALFRPTFLALGARFAARGVLRGAGDIVWLELNEVRSIVANAEARAVDLVERRRHEAEDDARIEPPELIVGDGFVPTAGGVGRVLDGVGTAGGRYRGRVRVVTSLEAGAALERGEVLVVRSSDVAWTPLFTRAGAVVTEAGGMLAHASIVARELAIPCVVSVPGATRLADGTEVTVDGYAGRVLVEEPSP
jgi:pyruvate,water dikinase